MTELTAGDGRHTHICCASFHEKSIRPPECEDRVPRPLLEHFIAHRLNVAKVPFACIIMDKG